MSYNMKELPQYINTAGKITVITSLLGVVVFAVLFLFNIGAQELRHAEAQDFATTTVTVLNTPPQWTIDAQESAQSSTSTPTNSGSAITWIATATDSNAESYYLLICSNGNAPTATSSPAVPRCGSGAVRWAVSAFTVSGTQASAATTTTEAFAESNAWFAWVCDAVALNPRCNVTSKQGTATTASPFNVNHRPLFSAFWDNSSSLTSVPGTTVTFTATSSDTDTVITNDTVKLIVCSTAGFNTTTDSCTASTIATSTFSASNPTASYLIRIPTQDQNYGAFGYIIDNHGHESAGVSQGSDSTLSVANAAPTVQASQIALNNGLDMILTQEAGQTTGFKLDYVVTDNNSCLNSSSNPEVRDYVISVLRNGLATTSCDGTGDYNANNCYTSTVATTTWNLGCAATTTIPSDCTGATDPTVTWSCTFPLWYIADPTDGVASDTIYFAQDWRAIVSAVDDNSATGTASRSSFAGVDVNSFMMMALDSAFIPYGQLEPGQRTDPLVASTTVRATGNVGLDQLLSGESMCTYYTSAVSCNNSASSTIAERNQVFATSSVTYGTASSTGKILSSTTIKRLDLNVKKSTTTVSQADGQTYWGINIPSTLTLAGSYRGENTFWGVVSSPGQW